MKAEPTTKLSQRERMRRPRELCANLPREAVLAAMEQMSEQDARITLDILNQVQPETVH